MLAAEELVPLSRVVKLLLRRPAHYIVVTAKMAHIESWCAEDQRQRVDPKTRALLDDLEPRSRFPWATAAAIKLTH